MGLVLRVVMLAAIIGSAAAADDALLSHAGRTLLQAKKDCPVSFDFEGSNVSIITSQCKGPLYKASLCCPAFKEFACPYRAYLNDPTTSCADQMVSYIQLYGKYPPGIFSNACKEGDQGLDCHPAAPNVELGSKAALSVLMSLLMT